MSTDPRDLSLSKPLQKVIDLGLIDLWLRGIVPLVPKKPKKELSDMAVDFNRHALGYLSVDSIVPADIEPMVGFRQVIAAASQRNIKIEVTMAQSGDIEIAFSPEKPFTESLVFGASYANVLPAIFGAARTVAPRR